MVIFFLGKSRKISHNLSSAAVKLKLFCLKNHKKIVLEYAKYAKGYALRTGIIFAYWSRLLITFANSMDPEQARQNVWPDLEPTCLTLMIFLKEIFKKVNLKK